MIECQSVYHSREFPSLYRPCDCPRFRAWMPTQGEFFDDAVEVRASDAAEAAERYLEREWADTEFLTEATVCVRDAEGKHTVYVVTVEEVPQFTAKECEHELFGEPPVCTGCSLPKGNLEDPEDLDALAGDTPASAGGVR